MAKQDIPSLYSRSMIEKLINDGLVLVNDRTVKKNYLLQESDKIEIEIPEPEPSAVIPENIPLDIVFEDEYLAVINKPAGVMVHPSPGNYSGTIANAVLHRYGKNLANSEDVLRPGIVHRLDKETSGLLLIAKDDRTLSLLNTMFSERRVKKSYKAVIAGTLDPQEGIIDKPVKRSTKDRTKMRVNSEGKEAVTCYAVEEEFFYFSLVDVSIETGRTHQIRVHFDSINRPVLGDSSYGAKKLKSLLPVNIQKKVMLYIERRLSRQALHAYRLGFEHPITGEDVNVEIQLPEDMANLVEWLRKHFS